jgi:hypothetical protein
MDLHSDIGQIQQDELIELRLPTEMDMQFIRWLWSDLETMRSVGGPIHFTDEQTQNWFTQMIKPGSPCDCYRLVCNENDKFLTSFSPRWVGV